MHKYFFLSSLLFLSSSTLLGQNQDSSLQIKTQILPTISVIGSRNTDYSVGNRIITIDSKLLEANATANLADILSTYAPAYLKTYGGAMLSTISLRGTSANHTAVLWNGFNINLPTLGQTDFNILPISPNTNIQIQLGAASSNYGTAAIGGAILLDNTLTLGKKQRNFLQQDIGSFGLVKTNVQVVASGEKMASQTTFSQNICANNFPFINKNRFGSPTETQENAAIQQISISQDLLWKVSKQSNFSLKVWNTESYRQIQPAMNTRNDQAKQTDKNFRMMAEYALQYPIRKNSDKKFGKITGETKVRVAHFNDILNYESDVVSNGNSMVQTTQTQVENTLYFNSRMALQTGADFQYFLATVDGYGTDNKIEKRNSIFALFRYQISNKLHISANFRQAFVEGFSPNPTPSLGICYDLLQDTKHILQLKGNLSTAYRVPTLNERFWKNSGNPNLKPENSYHTEISLLHSWTKDSWKMENSTTFYYSIVDNWILWKQGSRFWYPENILEVHARGAEIASKIRYTSNDFSILTGVQYQFTQSIQTKTTFAEEQNKQLIYVPLHTAGAFAMAQYKQYLLQIHTNYTGNRFILTDNSAFLPAYLLSNLALGYKYSIKNNAQINENIDFTLYLRINNASNETYQNMEMRAMPLRNYTISLQMSF